MTQKDPDYRHGTGHGVGHFLNVHEGEVTSALVDHSARCAETFLHIRLGPQGIGTRIGEQIIWLTSYSYAEVQYPLRSVQ
jgi:Xaa-Pro aminopeptidase